MSMQLVLTKQSYEPLNLFLHGQMNKCRLFLRQLKIAQLTHLWKGLLKNLNLCISRLKGGGSNPFQIFLKREILKSVDNGLIHPENKL